MREADRARVRVLGREVLERAAAEHLRARLQVDVDLEADDRLPSSSRAAPGRSRTPSACSSAWPARKSRFSENCGPISWRPTGQALGEAARDREAGSPAMFGGIASTSERYIASGSSVFAPSGKATVGEVGLTSRSNCSNAARELVADDRPHLLRLPVVGVVVARRERVGAEHDPALRLVAEARRRACARTSRGRRRRRHAEPVADAVVAGEVRRRLRRGDQVVAGQAVLDRAREGRLPHLGAELAAELDRARRPPR